ncbi:MAG: hypothetical protein QOJ94_220 [Sphingomonadales bacterium]|jgi:hypothetical protein|nr:hypothetical protein [Sphingomonadales bacterium]
MTLLLPLLLAAASPEPVPPFVALDNAHVAWMECAVDAAARAGAAGADAEVAIQRGWAACPREEAALRAAYARVETRATPAELDDLVAQDKRRQAFLLRAAATGQLRR